MRSNTVGCAWRGHCRSANAVYLNLKGLIWKHPLELLHVCTAFIDAKSVLGNLLFLSIVELPSRYVEVFPLNSTGDAAETLIRSINQAEYILPGQDRCKYKNSFNTVEFNSRDVLVRKASYRFCSLKRKITYNHK